MAPLPQFFARATVPAGSAPPVVDGVLDLVSIPAALVTMNGGAIVLAAVNRAFRQAELGSAGARVTPLAPLAGRVTRFLDREIDREEFDWACGDEIDTRHYRVTLARRDAREGAERCLVTLVDRTAELRTEANLRREMMTDALTGLPNRAGFTDRLEAVLGEGSMVRDAHAVLVINLDRFSRVNACLGGLAGDELLITTARRIKGALRARDLLARTGGDEFGVLLSLDHGQDDALHAAKRIEGALATPFRLADFEIRVSCSVGIAFGTDAGGDVEELVRHAQFAVKRSKQTGRTEAYQTQAFHILHEQFGLETALRRAIEGGAMQLSYQPICDLGTGEITAFEALARWTDDEGRARSPTEFIPVAEESGLIVPLGRWAIAEAARTLASWDRRAGGDCGVVVAVNLSPLQLVRDTIAPVVETALRENGLPGERFMLELTESALISDPDGVARTLHALKELGTSLAMDDFGTGYSNLAYLQKLPIDKLKIDRSFVTGMLADRDKVAIVRAILSLAQALNMKTTAEGIETVELAQTLAALGCTYGQGFHFAKPLESDAAYALLAARSQFPTIASAS